MHYGRQRNQGLFWKYLFKVGESKANLGFLTISSQSNGQERGCQKELENSDSIPHIFTSPLAESIFLAFRRWQLSAKCTERTDY